MRPATFTIEISGQCLSHLLVFSICNDADQNQWWVDPKIWDEWRSLIRDYGRALGINPKLIAITVDHEGGNYEHWWSDVWAVAERETRSVDTVGPMNMEPRVGVYLAKKWTGRTWPENEVRTTLTVHRPWALFLGASYLRELADRHPEILSGSVSDTEKMRRLFLAYSMTNQYVCLAHTTSWSVTALNSYTSPRLPGKQITSCASPVRLGEYNFGVYDRRSNIHWPRSSGIVGASGLYEGSACASVCTPEATPRSATEPPII